MINEEIEMSLEIKDPKMDKLARELLRYADKAGNLAVSITLREWLARDKQQQPVPAPIGLTEKLLQIGQECAALPILDGRAAEEILGYDQNGLPT
jgi:antitoxin VapB